MKWIRSNTVQNMFALWLAYLLFLIVMYVVNPGDPWIRMFHRPVFLIFAPLVVASIPWVGSKPAETDDGDDGRGYRRSGRRFVIPDKARRAAVVWLATLVVFASPHWRVDRSFDPVLHHPVFMILAPLLFACISLLIPGGVSVRTEVAETTPPLISRSRAWRGVVASVIFGGLVVLAMRGLNDPSVMNDAGSKLPPSIALLVLLGVDLVALWRSVKRLRTPG